MADKRISDLNSATTFVSTTADLLVLVQSGETKKITPANLLTSLNNSFTSDTQAATGAISRTTDVTKFTAIGAYTLAAPTGTEVTQKTILCGVTGASTVTLSNPVSGSYDVISFTTIGQSATVKYAAGAWWVVALVNATVA